MAKPKKPGPAPRIEASSMLSPQVTEALLSQLGASRTTDAVDEAQEIMFDAWDCDDRRRRVALARKALKVSPLCADAYVLLARETALTPEATLDLYVKGVAAGEGALGEAAFKEDVGLFWVLIETRPYMRARQGLALAQWACGRREEAASGAEDMLRLNPNDNQGIRYLLIDWFLQLGQDDKAALLFKRYERDGGTEWLWPATLAAFRAKGDAPASRNALKRAIAANANVATYLLGRNKLPRRMPDLIATGNVDEAVAHVEQAMPTWTNTPGALEWLAKQVAGVQRRGGRAKAAVKSSNGEP